MCTINTTSSLGIISDNLLFSRERVILLLTALGRGHETFPVNSRLPDNTLPLMSSSLKFTRLYVYACSADSTTVLPSPITQTTMWVSQESKQWWLQPQHLQVRSFLVDQSPLFTDNNCFSGPAPPCAPADCRWSSCRGVWTEKPDLIPDGTWVGQPAWGFYQSCRASENLFISHSLQVLLQKFSVYVLPHFRWVIGFYIQLFNCYLF